MADVTATLAGWSSLSNNNSPAGTTTVGNSVDDNFRELQGVIVRGLSHKGADIASTSTTDLGAVEGLMHDITGTTTISSFGTVREGILKIVKFEGALTLTHDATNLVLPGGANIKTANGDVAIFFSEGSGSWRCVEYSPVNLGYLSATSQTLTDGATVTWDVSAGIVGSLTLGGNRTMAAPTNLRVGTYILHVLQDGTGSRTITWNSVFKWQSGSAPTLSTAANARDIFCFISDGTNMYGSALLNVS